MFALATADALQDGNACQNLEQMNTIVRLHERRWINFKPLGNLLEHTKTFPRLTDFVNFYIKL